MIMIILCILLIVSLLQHEANSVTLTTKKLPLKDYTSCITEIGVGKYSFPELERFQQLPEDNPVLNKVLGCTWVKLGILGTNTHVNLDKLENYITKLVPNFEVMSENELVSARDIAEHCAELGSKLEGNSTTGQRVVRIINCINWYFEDMRLPQNYI